MFVRTHGPEGRGELQPADFVQTGDVLYCVTDVVIPARHVGAECVGVDHESVLCTWEWEPVDTERTFPPDTLRLAGVPVIEG